MKLPAGLERRAFTLGAVTTLLYLATAPAVVNLDGLGYLKLLPHNFAAGHLLYMPLLRATTRLVGDGLRAGRLLSALAGGAGVMLVYAIARRTIRDPFAAAFAAVGLALSYGYWVEAADVEAYAPATLALLATIYGLISYRERPSAIAALVVGALLGTAVLCHVTHVLLSLLVAVSLVTYAPDRRRGIGHAALALGLGGALCLGLYAYAALVVRQHDLDGALAWIRTAGHGFRYSGGWYRLADGVYGLAKAIVYSPYLDESDAQRLLGQFLLGLAPLLAFGGLLALRRRSLPPLPWRLGALWVGPYALLALAFFGSDSERWLFVLPALWLCAGALVAAEPRPARLGLAVAGYLALANLVTAVWPAHQDRWPKERAELVGTVLSDGDLVLFPGHSWDEYISFYSTAEIEPFPVAYYAARDGVVACLARLDREMTQARARSGHVYAVRLFDDLDDRRGFYEMESVGLSRSRLRERLLEGADVSRLAPSEGVAVYRIDPPPARPR